MTLSIEEIVRKVTEELTRTQPIQKVSGDTVIIFNGGEKNAQVLINKMRAEYPSARIVVTPSFVAKYGKPGFSNVYENISFSDARNLSDASHIILPTLTVSTLSKIAALITDDPVSYLIFQAVLKKRSVTVYSDSVDACAVLNGGMADTVLGYISKIKSYGITVTTSGCMAPVCAPAVYSPSVSTSQYVCSGDIATCTGCGLCVVQCPDQVSKIVSAGADRVSAGIGLPNPSASIGTMIDHTLLKADATEEQVRELCEEARQHTFASVCVNPTHVALAASLLRGTPVKVCTVIGFPLGATPPSVKAFETKNAIKDGAEEIDMVINIGALKSKNYRLVEDDIRAVVTACAGKLSKVILETALLTDEEKIKACALAKAAGADFVKTSTGFGPGGATAEDIKLMRTVVGADMGVKASGGVRDLETAREMVEAGASRIGASASVAIVKGVKDNTKGY